jgi:hypothetical protein
LGSGARERGLTHQGAVNGDFLLQLCHTLANHRWMRSAFFLLSLALAGEASAQNRALGVFGLWGAFEGRGRCYAVAEPYRVLRPVSGRGYASIGYWPGRGVRGQVHVRLSRPKRPGSAVLLRIDDRTFQLLAGGDNAWAPDRRGDAEIVAAMRTGIEMTVETRAEGGALLRDSYRLRGAATAIDAAAIACAR